MTATTYSVSQPVACASNGELSEERDEGKKPRPFTEGSEEEWIQTTEDIDAACQGLAHGEISAVEVSLEAEVLFRREMGKKLVFLTLCRIGTAPEAPWESMPGKAVNTEKEKAASNTAEYKHAHSTYSTELSTEQECGNRQGRHESKDADMLGLSTDVSELKDAGGEWGLQDQPLVVLESAIEYRRYYNPNSYSLDLSLLRPGAHVSFQGVCGTSLRTGQSMLYVTSAKLIRAVPHTTYVSRIVMLLKKREASRERIAQWLGGISIEHVAELEGLDKMRLRNACAILARLLAGRNPHRDRNRASRISFDALVTLRESAALVDGWEPLLLGDTADAGSGKGAGESEMINISISLPEELGEQDVARRQQYAHGKKAPQVRWFIARLLELTSGTYKSVWQMDATQVMDGGDDVPKGAHAVKYPDQSVSAADIDGVAHSCCGDNMRTERSGCVGTHGVKVRDRSKCEYVLSEGHSIDRLSLSELGCAGMVEGGEGGGSEAVAPTDVGGCPRGCLDCHDVGSKGIGSDDVGSKARLIKGREDVGSQDFGILDVGGGRGDLAVNICMNMPQVRKVCVIDVNNKSLDAGRARVASLAPSQDVIFECASVEEHQRVSELLGDCARKVVIGLHCCGGLSDAVLNIAVDSDWPFLVCPCCFLKNKHLRSWDDQDRENLFGTLASIAELSSPHEKTVQTQASGQMWIDPFYIRSSKGNP